MKNEATSLYAGKIEISINGIRMKPKRISIRKSLKTVTDTFSFIVPTENSNGEVSYIPNLFGLNIDVYVNDEFYIGGILINRALKGTDIECECSTHGWQLSNSDIFEEEEYKGNVLGDFINEACKNNLKIEYSATTLKTVQNISPVLYSALKEYKYSDQNQVSKEVSVDNSYQGNIDFCFINDVLVPVVYQKKLVQFVIYDPYGLYNTKLNIFLNNKDNKIKSEYGETIFEYIKKVTKNLNVFVKCIGLFKDLKPKLNVQKIYPEPINDERTYVYVLLLYRPGIDKEIFSWDKIEKDRVFQTQISKDITTGKPIGPQSVVTAKYFTYEYLKEIGYITNDGTNKSNCINDPTELYSGKNEHSVYILRNKKNKNIASAKGIEDEKAIKELTEKDILFSKSRFNSVNKLGTIKNLFVDEDLTEYAMKRRLNYEINAIKAESYKIEAKVIGYTMDMNFEKANYSEKEKNIFWDFNRVVIVNSPAQGIDDLKLIVGEMEMVYDSNNGAYTNLTLIPPLSYNASELNVEDEYIGKKIKAEARAKSINDSKLKLALYGAARGIVEVLDEMTEFVLPKDTAEKYRGNSFGKRMDDWSGINFKEANEYTFGKNFFKVNVYKTKNKK